MHSSSADWVLGDARLISSTSRKFANTGPGRNSNSLVRWLKTLTPVTSDGSRSGVNWSREKEQSTERASAFASVVFPTPGKSSIIRWPSASRQRTVSSRIVSGAWTTLPRFSTRRRTARAGSSRGAVLRSGSSIPLPPPQPDDLVEDLARDLLLRRLLDPALACRGNENDFVGRCIEADVVSRDIVEDDQIGPLRPELLACPGEAGPAVVSREAD